MVANKTTVECARSWNQTASQSVARRDHWSEQLKHGDASIWQPFFCPRSIQLLTTPLSHLNMQMLAFGSLSLIHAEHHC